MSFTLHEKFVKQFTLSGEIYAGFISIFHDRNPLHTDEPFALSKGFRGKLMHGNILNGFLSYFIGECLPLKNVIIHSQQIEFKNPVYLDDVLDLEAVVSGIFESVNAVEFKCTFHNSNRLLVAKAKIQIGLL